MKSIRPDPRLPQALALARLWRAGADAVTGPDLQRQALGLSESVVMGVAGAAPAFSIAATLATLTAAVGELAPASLLYCGLVMFGAAFAFRRLSWRQPDAGASFTWISDSFGSVLGFLAGWTLLVSSVLFMVSGTLPAATATLALLAPALVENTAAATLTAAGWLVFVGVVVLKGIKVSSYVQVAMTGIEVTILCGLIIAALLSPAAPAHALRWSGLLGAGFTPGLFVSGALTALFFFWGWDVTANLNEETRGEGRLTGRATLLTLILVLALFVCFALATLRVMSDVEIEAAGTNVVLGLAHKLLPGHWAEVAVIAVVLSTIGTLETTVLQFSRALFVMARRGTMPARFARLHARFQTPLQATLLIIVLGLAMLALSSPLPSIAVIIRDSVNAIGIQAAFYYGLTALVCAWRERAGARQPGVLVTGILWPVLTAAALFAVALYSLPTLDATALIVGVGGIVTGLVPLALRKVRAR